MSDDWRYYRMDGHPTRVLRTDLAKVERWDADRRRWVPALVRPEAVVQDHTPERRDD